jgi:hypothetical protein
MAGLIDSISFGNIIDAALLLINTDVSVEITDHSLIYLERFPLDGNPANACVITTV